MYNKIIIAKTYQDCEYLYGVTPLYQQFRVEIWKKRCVFGQQQSVYVRLEVGTKLFCEAPY